MSQHGGVSSSRVRLALAGLLAGISGVAVSQALTNLFNARATPIQEVAEAVIAKTPGSVAEALIHVVGRNDKPFLVTGVTVAILLLSALAGLVAGRSRLIANLIFIAMAVVALVAAMSGSDFSPVSVVPLAVGALTWLLVLAFLVDAVPSPVPAPAWTPSAAPADAAKKAPIGTDESRRRFLIKAAGVTVAAVVVGVGSQFLGRARRAVETSRRLLRLPVSSGTVPQGAQLDLPGLTPWRVSDDHFYRIDTALVLPAVDPTSWKLRIHGMVDREITLTYRDLLDRKLTEDWVTICCVSNPVGGELIGNAWWSGVRIADILGEAGVQAGADAVRQKSRDGWTCGTPIEAVTDNRNAMLAIAMNGEPLPIEHGFPVRMIVPGLYGYVSACKWIVDIEVTTYDRFSAYWTERGWSAKGPVKTESRIDVPRDGRTVNAGSVRVGGSAWAQHTGIEKVEFRLDGDAWKTAELGRVPSNDTWVQWSGTVDASSGSHQLAVRATDKSGYTQTPVRLDVVPDGATGWHTIDFKAS
jgi:DMSO/TMAO reductase YedYZ molybdopterin-dependent catalytic subunit